MVMWMLKSGWKCERLFCDEAIRSHIAIESQSYANNGTRNRKKSKYNTNTHRQGSRFHSIRKHLFAREKVCCLVNFILGSLTKYRAVNKMWSTQVSVLHSCVHVLLYLRHVNAERIFFSSNKNIFFNSCATQCWWEKCLSTNTSSFCSFKTI